MGGAQEGARKSLDLGIAAIRHAARWLQWQTNGEACREVADLGLLHPTAVGAGRPAA